MSLSNCGNPLPNARYVSQITQGELLCLQIRHPVFSADLLLQGAQLISYAPLGEDNWLWLSEQAEFRQGVSVRGGIPLCWPWFGNAAMNPDNVRQHIASTDDAPAHGFARGREWTLTEVDEDDDSLMLVLQLADTAHEQWQASLQVEAEFRFTASSVSVTLTTENSGSDTVSFSQALHTYFPTADIGTTRIEGFDGCRYIDTLENWKEKIQAGAITFNGETDRIYFGEDPLTLITNDYSAELNAQGSQSSVVWNPWTEKAQRLSQFADDAYLRMFCVETANAAADAIRLGPADSHSMSLLLTRNQ